MDRKSVDKFEHLVYGEDLFPELAQFGASAFLLVVDFSPFVESDYSLGGLALELVEQVGFGGGCWVGVEVQVGENDIGHAVGVHHCGCDHAGGSPS